MFHARRADPPRAPPGWRGRFFAFGLAVGALFWLLGWGMNYAWVMVHATPEPRAIGSSAVVDVAYWVSPKPIYLGLILFNALDAQEHFDKPEAFKAL